MNCSDFSVILLNVCISPHRNFNPFDMSYWYMHIYTFTISCGSKSNQYAMRHAKINKPQKITFLQILVATSYMISDETFKFPVIAERYSRVYKSITNSLFK